MIFPRADSIAVRPVTLTPTAGRQRQTTDMAKAPVRPRAKMKTASMPRASALRGILTGGRGLAIELLTAVAVLALQLAVIVSVGAVVRVSVPAASKE